MAKNGPTLRVKEGGPSKFRRFGKDIKTVAAGAAIVGIGALGVGIGLTGSKLHEARRQQVVSVAHQAFEMGKEVGRMEKENAGASSSLSEVYARHGAFYSVLAHRLTGEELKSFNLACREANANPVVAADILFEHGNNELHVIRRKAEKEGDPYAKEILLMKAAVLSKFAQTPRLNAIAEKVRKEAFFVGGPVDALYGRIKDRAPAIHYNSVIRPDGTIETIKFKLTGPIVTAPKPKGGNR